MMNVMSAQVSLVGKRKAGAIPALSRNCKDTIGSVLYLQQRRMKSGKVSKSENLLITRSIG